MTFEEIILRLRQRDDRVTQCFFFWDGPSLARIEEVRRTDPAKASRMPRPVCNSCKPGLLSVLHRIYGEAGFDYNTLVSDFYFYLIKDDKLASIKEPDALMGWIVRTAYYFFLHGKIGADKELENVSIDTLNNAGKDIEEDKTVADIREKVEEILSAMPNRTYAKILDEITLEVGQYQGRQKSELLKKKADEFGIPVDNLYVKISLAKKQFKETARKLKIM